MGYTLNADAARQGDMQSLRISETGAYKGHFTRAEKIISEKETEGIEFSFEADDKATADFLNLWTLNAKGEQIYGFKQLMALMTCLRVKNITESEMMVEKFQNGQKVRVKATVYQELMKRPIGILLQKEEYEKRSGEIGYKFNFAGFFDAQSGMTATEILDKAPRAEKLEKMKAALRDKPMQKARVTSGSAPNGPAPSGYSDFDPEVGF